ncbi:hypothetical protein [Eudoraea sp.]
MILITLPAAIKKPDSYRYRVLHFQTVLKANRFHPIRKHKTTLRAWFLE